MHQNSINEMKKFLDRFDRHKPLKILDVGSRIVDNQVQCYGYLISDEWEYIGLDIEAGENVDIVSNRHYKYPFDSATFDIIISGQTLEHISFPWLWIEELWRLLKRGGWICIIAPSVWPEHRYPKDCWRILPDGMEALFAYAGFKNYWVYTERTNPKFVDCVGEAQK